MVRLKTPDNIALKVTNMDKLPHFCRFWLLGILTSIVLYGAWPAASAESADDSVQESFTKGLSFLNFQNRTVDLDKAARWFRKIVRDGHTEAQFYLALIHYLDPKGPVPYYEAVEWMSQAARRGHPIAKVLAGNGTELHELAQLLAGRDAKMADAQYYLGLMYLRGVGLYPSVDTAVQLFAAAAVRGHAEATASLRKMSPERLYTAAPMYFVLGDKEMGARVLLIAAENGHVPAQRAVGVLYRKGLGVQQDFGEAARWLQRAADQGDREAGVELNDLMELGRSGGKSRR